MCMQCMMTATTTVGAASGIRAWLGQHRAHWLTPKRLRYITIGLMTVALLVAGTMSGSS
jgi:hypothetical protein